MTLHIFYEAHKNWDSALTQMRLIFEPLHAPGALCQTATFLDDGNGSTGKGALRELVETCDGVHNGKEQLGYACTLTAEALCSKKCEAPSEQKANLFLCAHSFIDDFSPNTPLNNVALRQLTGGNNLTAARKNAAEHVFKFNGQLYLLVNGPWRPTEPFIGNDRRRHAGLSFDVKFVDQPRGKNEAQKDASVKGDIVSYFAEYWFLARVFWLVPRPWTTSDRTMPRCPNSEQVVRLLMEESDNNVKEVSAAHVERFLRERLIPYELQEAKPSSIKEVDTAFERFLMETAEEHKHGVDSAEAQRSLREKLFYKPGHSLNKRGARKKTSVNVYMYAEAVYTLKEPEALALERAMGSVV